MTRFGRHMLTVCCVAFPRHCLSDYRSRDAVFISVSCRTASLLRLRLLVQSNSVRTSCAMRDADAWQQYATRTSQLAVDARTAFPRQQLARRTSRLLRKLFELAEQTNCPTSVSLSGRDLSTSRGYKSWSDNDSTKRWSSLHQIYRRLQQQVSVSSRSFILSTLTRQFNYLCWCRFTLLNTRMSHTQRSIITTFRLL